MRVVVTGIGLVTPLGLGTKVNWQRLCKGETAIRSTGLLKDLFDTLPSRVAAWIDESSYERVLAPAWRSLPKYVQYALIAAEEAVTAANIGAVLGQLGRAAGVCIGSGMGPLDVIGEAAQTLMQRGARRVTPHLIPRILPNMAAGHVSIRWGIRGPSLAPSTACATGVHAIGDAFRLIKYGHTKLMLAGATEAAVNPLSMAGFCQARALSTAFNEHPAASSRPFDRARSGFVIGEGAAVLVLEVGSQVYGGCTRLLPASI